MVTSTTVNTKIIVNFEDKFTEAACQAVETYRKCLENAFKLQKQTPSSFLENATKGIEQFSKSVNGFKKDSDQVLREMVRIQKQSEEAAPSVDLFSQAFARLEEDAIKVNTILLGLAIPTAIVGFIALPPQIQTVMASLTLLYATWKIGQSLPEWRVRDKPIDEYLKTVSDSFENLASAKPLELQIISQDISVQLSEVERLKRQFEAQRGLFLHLNLDDKATDEALNVRNKLEKTFKDPITQIIKVEEVQARMTFRKSPNPSDLGDSGGDSSGSSSGSGDSGGGFDGSSVNPGGFDTFPSFSAGIDRVPRDMLAMIHKDETVLTKSEAEERRRGNSGGLAIQRVSINMNMPDSFNPSNMKRQDFRQFAMKLQDELHRLDRRRSL